MNVDESADESFIFLCVEGCFPKQASKHPSKIILLSNFAEQCFLIWFISDSLTRMHDKGVKELDILSDFD